MTLARTTGGINKVRTPARRTGKSSPPRRSLDHPDGLGQLFPRISWLDPPGDLV